MVILTLLLYRLIKKQWLPTDANLWFIVIPALILICYISGFEKSRSHYIMVIYPYLALTFGYCINVLTEFFGRKSKILPSIVFPTLFAPPFYSAVFAAFVFYNGDTRQLLYKWGKANFDSRFPIMYSDQSSSVVLKSFAKNIYRVPAGDINVPEGYLYSQDDSFPFETLQKKARVLNLLFEVDNKYLNGPNIKFYSYSL